MHPQNSSDGVGTSGVGAQGTENTSARKAERLRRGFKEVATSKGLLRGMGTSQVVRRKAQAGELVPAKPQRQEKQRQVYVQGRLGAGTCKEGQQRRLQVGVRGMRSQIPDSYRTKSNRALGLECLEKLIPRTYLMAAHWRAV